MPSVLFWAVWKSNRAQSGHEDVVLCVYLARAFLAKHFGVCVVCVSAHYSRFVHCSKRMGTIFGGGGAGWVCGWYVWYARVAKQKRNLRPKNGTRHITRYGLAQCSESLAENGWWLMLLLLCCTPTHICSIPNAATTRATDILLVEYRFSLSALIPVLYVYIKNTRRNGTLEKYALLVINQIFPGHIRHRAHSKPHQRGQTPIPI